MGKWLDKIKEAKEPSNYSRIGPGDYLLYVDRIYERTTRNKGDMHCAKVTPLEATEDEVQLEQELGDGKPLTHRSTRVGKQTDMAFWTGSNDMAMPNLMAMLSCIEYGNTSGIFEANPKDAEALIDAASVDQEDESAFTGEVVRCSVEYLHSKGGYLYPRFDFSPASDDEKKNAASMLEAARK